MTEREKRVQWIYSSRDNKELAERYDRWARDYDEDLEEGFGWLGPQCAVDFLVRYVSREAKILDAGAGTGLVGELLAKQGYNNMVAMDISQGMLEEARQKNVYREFHQMVMGEPLDYPSDSFDGIISVGVLTVTAKSCKTAGVAKHLRLGASSTIRAVVMYLRAKELNRPAVPIQFRHRAGE